MIVEVVAVGTELLLGQIVNSNASDIAAKLAEAGLDAHYQQVVGDNLARISAALRLALERADAVVVTGGIGPTQDDITREAICAATGRSMLHSEEYAAALVARWESLGRTLPRSNLRQADYPEGAVLLSNPKGTAPGLFLEHHHHKMLFAVPGVPQEMRHLMDNEVLPRLRAAAGLARTVKSRVIRTWGLPESTVGEMLADLFDATTNPSIAFLASAGEIKVRITAGGADEVETGGLIAPVESEIRARLGSAVFGTDDETIETVLQGLLTSRGWTIGVAESATAGLVGSRLASISGSSQVFRGGFIAYSGEAKTALLGVDVSRGTVSEEVALAMARGVVVRLPCDVGVAVTGSAGPEPLERPVGTVIVGVVTPEGENTRVLRMPGDRERVRTYAATAALQLARLALTGAWWSG